VKRFTDTEMPLRPWYRSLEPRLKCLWVFMLCRCDMAGVLDMDWPLASFSIGAEVGPEDLNAMNGNIVVLPSGKLFLPGFIRFQYGELRESRVHEAVLKALRAHGIPYPYPMDTLSRVSDTLKDKDKDKEQAKDKAQEGVQGEADAPKQVRPRNALMDALMMVESGTCDGATKAAWSKVAKALSEIKGATPDVTPAEIARRAVNYKGHFDGAVLTATALSSHWARCNEGKKQQRTGSCI